MSAVENQKQHEVKTTVGYLPAARPFKKDYESDTSLSVVRAEAMAFFEIADYTDRDQHFFHLHFEGQRVEDLGRTVGDLVGERGKRLELEIVEQVVAG